MDVNIHTLDTTTIMKGKSLLTQFCCVYQFCSIALGSTSKQRDFVVMSVENIPHSTGSPCGDPIKRQTFMLAKTKKYDNDTNKKLGT